MQNNECDSTVATANNDTFRVETTGQVKEREKKLENIHNNEVQLAELRQELSRSHNEIKMLEKTNERAEQACVVIRQQFAEASQELFAAKQQFAETHHTLAKTQKQLLETQQQLVECIERVAYHEMRIHQLFTSNSWRLTQPIRALNRVFRSIGSLPSTCYQKLFAAQQQFAKSHQAFLNTQKQLCEIQQQLQETQRQHAQILTSNSWRVTRRIRAINRILRSINSLLSTR